MAFNKRTDWGPADESDEGDQGDYDLVVVGAGLSGLAAATFYREQNSNARVLLLDNHDDFGGHAKRNEFEWQGRTILGYGGSQSLEAPGSYSDVVTDFLVRIGVDTARLADAYDQSFYKRNGLTSGVYFDRAHYGTDRVVPSGLTNISAFIPVASSRPSNFEAVDQMPIPEAARLELKRLLDGGKDLLPEHSIFNEPGYLRSIAYLDF